MQLRITPDRYIQLTSNGALAFQSYWEVDPHVFPLMFGMILLHEQEINGVRWIGQAQFDNNLAIVEGGPSKFFNSVERFDSNSMVHSDLDAVGVHVTGSWLPADCVR